MLYDQFLILIVCGLSARLLAGLLGIGGGFVVVSILIALGYAPAQAVATSSFAIVIKSVFGSLQNFRMGCLSLWQVAYLRFSTSVTSQMDVHLREEILSSTILLSLGIFFIDVYLSNPKEDIDLYEEYSKVSTSNLWFYRVRAGEIADFLSDFLRIGDSAIIVPLQMILLKKPSKVSVRTSLGALVVTKVSASIGHAVKERFCSFQLNPRSWKFFWNTSWLPQSKVVVARTAFHFSLESVSMYMF